MNRPERGGFSQARSALKQRFLFFLLNVGEYCHSSEWAAVAPWVGTLVGSWIVGANTGSWVAVAIGALIAAVGCAPVAASARWARLQNAQTGRQDARERMVMQYCSLVLLPQLGEFSHLPAPARVAARDTAVIEAANYLASRVFSGDEQGLRKAKSPTRVVVYALGDTQSVLEVVHQAGRDDPATSFDLEQPGRGEKVYQDLLRDEPTYESEITGRRYTSYISTPISSSSYDIYGMISVDTTDVTQLSEEDGSSLEVIASALAVFYQEADRDEVGEIPTPPTKSVRGSVLRLFRRRRGKSDSPRASLRG